MKIQHFTDAKSINLEDDVATHVSGRVVLGKADGIKDFTMRFFELGKGGCTPWYYFEWDHKIFIHAGIGEVLYKDEWIPLSEGYVIHIPADEEHQIRNRGDSTLVIMSILPTSDFEL